jgi:hypothetical protein
MLNELEKNMTLIPPFKDFDTDALVAAHNEIAKEIRDNHRKSVYGVDNFPTKASGVSACNQLWAYLSELKGNPKGRETIMNDTLQVKKSRKKNLSEVEKVDVVATDVVATEETAVTEEPDTTAKETDTPAKETDTTAKETVTAEKVDAEDAIIAARTQLAEERATALDAIIAARTLLAEERTAARDVIIAAKMQLVKERAAARDAITAARAQLAEERTAARNAITAARTQLAEEKAAGGNGGGRRGRTRLLPGTNKHAQLILKALVERDGMTRNEIGLATKTIDITIYTAILGNGKPDKPYYATSLIGLGYVVMGKADKKTIYSITDAGRAAVI